MTSFFMPNLHDEIELKIEKMANEGKGLGRHDNQVVFVPLSAPGDTLKVKITKKSKNFCEAEILDIITPSPDRINPPCQYYGDCGGCNFQHISYAKQLEIKNSLVEETLKKFLKLSSLPMAAPQGSPAEFNYRNRIQLHHSQDGLGFYRRKSHQLLPIKSCLITEEKINSYMADLKLAPASSSDEKIELYLDQNLNVAHRSVTTETGSYLFSQVNRFQNENLVNTVVALVQKSPATKIYDLYAGSGNFTFPLATAIGKSEVVAVELGEELVKQGQQVKLQKANQLKSKVTFTLSSVEYFLRNVRLQTTDLVLLDPPRTGCHPEVMQILASKPLKKGLYISCNYITLARDLSLLSETAKNWGLSLQIDHVQCFDMFPQTDHIEVLVSFTIS